MVDSESLAQRIVERHIEDDRQMEIVIEDLERFGDNQVRDMVAAWNWFPVIARIWNFQNGPSQVRKEQMVKTVYCYALNHGVKFAIVQAIRNKFPFVLN